LGRHQDIIRIDRALGLAAALAGALALGGCGGVQFEGKVFDYMGVSGDRQEADVRMSERPPLLLPPNYKSLPQPGVANPALARQDWPEDPERAKKRVVAEQKAQEAAKEAKNDPLNPMAGKPTLLDKWLGRSEDEVEPIADVPEPDPSDRLPGESGQESGVAEAGPEPLTPHVSQAPIERPEAPQSPNSYDPAARRSLY
jgi:hypothetical protein